MGVREKIRGKSFCIFLSERESNPMLPSFLVHSHSRHSNMHVHSRRWHCFLKKVLEDFKQSSVISKDDKVGRTENAHQSRQDKNGDLDQWWTERSGQIADIVWTKFPDRRKIKNKILALTRNWSNETNNICSKLITIRVKPEPLTYFANWSVKYTLPLPSIIVPLIIQN